MPVNRHIELIVGRSCRSCDEAEALWRRIAADLEVTITVRRIDTKDESSTDVSALPVLQVDGRAIAVGVPAPARAHWLLEQALAAQ